MYNKSLTKGLVIFVLSYYECFDIPSFIADFETYELKDQIINILKNGYDDTAFYNRLLDESSKMTINDINTKLNEKGITTTLDNIRKIIYQLLVNDGALLKYDNFNGEAKFLLLDKYRTKSSLSETHTSLEFHNINQRILLISDTHLKEDYYLINELYNYANKNNIKRVFHLADLFEDVKDITTLKNTITKFAKNYPQNIKTYTILGNHDTSFNEILRTRSRLQSFDLRGLSFYNPNFEVMPKQNIKTSLANEKLTFSHRFYLNEFISNLKVKYLEDIIYWNNIINFESGIHISGHLHQGFVLNLLNGNQNNLYIGVPATNYFNANKAIAFILDIKVSNQIKSIDIIPLKYINNQVKEENNIYLDYQNPKLIKKLI